MKERVVFKVELLIEDEPEVIEKLETKFVNLSLKGNVISSHISKYYL